MKIKGMDSWLERIETLKREFPKETGQFLLKQANAVIRDAKLYTPVDTSALINGWHRTGKSERKEFQQIVYNNTEYAAHVEYGHRTRLGTGETDVKKGTKYRPKSRIFRSDGTRTVHYVKGRRMLHKAMFNRKLNFYRDLEKMMSKLMR
ncbi:HK97 gp10 family phage protein [Fusobacterium ulcerans]|uniref:HK97 gp10 family phage protein n=1 Tax=Fusobacterium ulcerans TaxID=861 RepID=UPI002E7A4074|nr:HK97 gp10 family phage protein [Fusobacterium ulcerans]MEE0139282.1 HK97 gp10 family phage protein [Fusobacterium ulcerans]